ncbi:sensor histidine kinase [Aequorivita aquimaris]|uniref:sensor histidine kinase n=1 Tax=Aequorivita aquimaris TaxID=1548749 RepID=UPI00138F4D79|nr:histidine kinase [Aequorivita aquimaris]
MQFSVPVTYYKAINDTVSVGYLVSRPLLFTDNDIFPKQSNGKDAYWLKLDFSGYSDMLEEGISYFLHAGRFLEVQSFSKAKDGITSRDFGYFNRRDIAAPNLPTRGILFKKSELFQNSFLLLKVKRYTSNKKPTALTFTFETEQSHQFRNTYLTKREMISQIPLYLFIGAFLFILIFIVITYGTVQRADFLFYALYIFCLLLYLGKSAFDFETFLNDNYPYIGYLTHSQLQIWINLFYVSFAKYYLETDRNYPKLDKAIYAVAILLFSFLVIETFLLFTQSFEAHFTLMNIHRSIMSLFAAVSLIYLLVFAKNRLAYFIVIGSLAFTAGALGMLFTLNKNYMIMGSSLEVLLFGLGLNYKIKLHYRQQQKLKQEAFENKVTALRAQMNPHFVFNSLSSIQHLITENNKEAAIKYLNKFSIIMRNLLESSIQGNIVLSEEISLLKKYLALEALRFDDSFTYNVSVAENLDVHSVEIPALLVQPFVENAILHGLRNKSGNDKCLKISFKKEKRFIVCEVEDNGIGRKASAERKSVLKIPKKSRGIKVTEKRLELLNNSEENSIEIIDKINAAGESEGTLVIIKISIE